MAVHANAVPRRWSQLWSHAPRYGTTRDSTRTSEHLGGPDLRGVHRTRQDHLSRPHPESRSYPRSPWGYSRSGQVDYERSAATAERTGRVPACKRLVVTRTAEEIQLALVDAPDAAPMDVVPVPVPARVAKHHPAVSALRSAPDQHEVSRVQLPRALRILHTLAVESEKRGFQVSAVTPQQIPQTGAPTWSGERDGHLQITALDQPVVLRIREDGVASRAIHPRSQYSYGDERPARRSMAHEAGVQGTLRISIVSPWTRSSRQRTWGDGKRQHLEELLPSVLHEVQASAADARERERQAELKAQRREAAWNGAMAKAELGLVEHRRAEVLGGQVDAWRQANEIRAFCSAIDAARPGDSDAQAWTVWARTYAASIDPSPASLAYRRPRTACRRRT